MIHTVSAYLGGRTLNPCELDVVPVTTGCCYLQLVQDDSRTEPEQQELTIREATGSTPRSRGPPPLPTRESARVRDSRETGACVRACEFGVLADRYAALGAGVLDQQCAGRWPCILGQIYDYKCL